MGDINLRTKIENLDERVDEIKSNVTELSDFSFTNLTVTTNNTNVTATAQLIRTGKLYILNLIPTYTSAVSSDVIFTFDNLPTFKSTNWRGVGNVATIILFGWWNGNNQIKVRPTNKTPETTNTGAISFLFIGE